jgi:hypothetical protein
MSATEASLVDEDERASILNAVIADYARDGWAISAVFAGQAIAKKKDRLGGNNFWFAGIFWTLNIIVAAVTGGLWLIVLAIIYLTRGTETVVIAVDEYGRFTAS